jgi:hypothetical protein
VNELFKIHKQFAGMFQNNPLLRQMAKGGKAPDMKNMAKMMPGMKNPQAASQFNNLMKQMGGMNLGNLGGGGGGMGGFDLSQAFNMLGGMGGLPGMGGMGGKPKKK